MNGSLTMSLARIVNEATHGLTLNSKQLINRFSALITCSCKT